MSLGLVVEPARFVAVVDARSPLLAQLVSRVLTAAEVEVVAWDTIDPDVVVLIEPTAREWTRASDQGAGVVLLTEQPCTGAALHEAIERGALGVLQTSCAGSELMLAVRMAATGDTALSRAQTRDLCDAIRERSRTQALDVVRVSAREHDILRSISAGESMKQTARTFGISPRTVENTQRMLFRKLGVRNRAQAIARAHALGLLADEVPA